MKHPAPKPGLDGLRKILVFRIGHLGDTITALPAFHALRRSFPTAHIALLSNQTGDGSTAVAANSVLPARGLFDSGFAYSSDASNALFKLLALVRLHRRLRRARFDAVFYLMTRNRAARSVHRDRLFFRTAGIRRMIGDRHLLENRLDFSQTRPLQDTTREAEFLLEILSSSGISGSLEDVDLLLSEAELRVADDWLEHHVPNGENDKILALAPGAKWPSKVWSESRFIEVVSALRRRHSIVPVVFGGPEDRACGDRILSAVGGGANAAGDLGVRQAAAAMRRTNLYLGNDTGTMHLAAAVGVPCVAIFAAIDYPGRWLPLGSRHRTFRTQIECEGCHTPHCFNQHKCLSAIEVGRVGAACDDLLMDAGTS